jgi:molybdenum cofactor cytidylyltransferase
MSVAAIILAAGRSTRFALQDDRSTKLVSLWRGAPLVRHVAEAARASGASPIFVVTGHGRRRVEDALNDLDLRFVHNAEYASGLSTSLRIGLTALSGAASGVLVLLGDMPKLKASTLRRLVTAHEEAASDIMALVPAFARRRGNPVLLRSEGLVCARALNGDEGARALLRAFHERVVEVPVDDEGVLVDVDRQEDLSTLGA